MSETVPKNGGMAVAMLIALSAVAAPAVCASPDFSGYWRLAPPGPGPGPGLGLPGTDAPGSGAGLGPGPAIWQRQMERLQPWAQEKVRKLTDALKAGDTPPTNANQCLPWALPGMDLPGGPAYSMNLVQTSSELVEMFQMDHQSHIVYLNQRHPAVLAASYFGDSVGHWEGQTLVVDSTGFNDRTAIFDGIPHTAALHVIERVRLDQAGELIWESTFEDPGAFLAPIVISARYTRTGAFQEYVCAENNHEAAAPDSR